MKSKFIRGRYLVQTYTGQRVDEVEILQVTYTAYYIKWESGVKSWRTIADFESEYIFLEKL